MNSDIKKITLLIDTYGRLLTEIKYSYLVKHYFDDMSLNEIANIYNVSRAAIHSSITSAINELNEYEEKLFFLKKQKKRIKLYNQITDNNLKDKLLDLEFNKGEDENA